MLGESVRRRQQPARPARPRPKSPIRWKRILLAVPVALALSFGLGYLFAVRVLFPPPPVSGTGIAVPELIGRTLAEAQRQLAGAGLGAVEPMELPHPTAPPGQVVAQSPLPGQHLLPGAAVQVAVSAGRPRALVPDVIGFTSDRADAMLRRAGFEVTQAVEESAAPAGRVIRTDPAPGQDVTLPTAVILVVSSGRAVVQDTVQPDTLPRMQDGR